MRQFKSSVLLLLIAVVVSGCSQVRPFVDARREAGQVQPIGSSRPEFPVVCAGILGNQETYDALADNECAKVGKTAVFERSEAFSCRLLTPRKLFYKCIKTDKPVQPYVSECEAERLCR